MTMSYHCFVATKWVKYSQTSPQWPPQGQKKVVVVEGEGGGAAIYGLYRYVPL